MKKRGVNNEEATGGGAGAVAGGASVGGVGRQPSSAIRSSTLKLAERMEEKDLLYPGIVHTQNGGLAARYRRAGQR
jgi:hypothetical protein